MSDPKLEGWRTERERDDARIDDVIDQGYRKNQREARPDALMDLFRALTLLVVWMTVVGLGFRLVYEAWRWILS